MQSIFQTSFAPLLLALLVLSPAAQAQENLGWRFTQGEHFELGLGERTIATDESTLFEPALRGNVVLFFDWHVQAVDEHGNANICLTFQSVQIYWKNAGSEWICIDTAHPREQTEETQQLVDAVAVLVGEQLEMRLTPRGEMSSLAYVDFSDEEYQQAAATSPLNRFTTTALHALLKRCLPVLPAQADPPPQTWHAQLAVAGSPIETVHDIEYTRDETAEDEEPATPATYEITASQGENTRFDPARRVSVDSQESSGQLTFDLVAGRMVASELEQRVHYAGANQNGRLVENISITLSELHLYPVEE